MSSYYVSIDVDVDGMHIVHEEGCEKMPDEFNRAYVGEYFTEVEAVEGCKENFYPNSDGCAICCPDGHFR